MRTRLGSPRVLVSSTVAGLLVAGSTVGAAAPAPGAYLRPGHITRVSVSSDGAQARYPAVDGPGAFCSDANFLSGSDISADGRYVAFVSYADNLVPGDTNQVCDIFRHDRVTGRTIRVSVASDGSQALYTTSVPPLRDRWSIDPSISDDGRYISFQSSANNLTPGTSTPGDRIFVHDVVTRVTRLASLSVKGEILDSAVFSSISGDGRYVSFQDNGARQILVRDLRLNRTVLASARDQTDQPGNGLSQNNYISGNGRFVAFSSTSSDLVPGNTAEEHCECGPMDVYVRDLALRRTYRVSVASDGSQANFSSFPTCTVGYVPVCYSEGNLRQYANGGWISDDGRYIAFSSVATNLVPNDTNYTAPAAGRDMFVHDRVTRRTERISVDAYGQQINEIGVGTVISGDGRFVTYQAESDPFDCHALPVPQLPPLPPDATFLIDCPRDIRTFVHDRVDGSADWVTATVRGEKARRGRCLPVGYLMQSNSGDYISALSRDGRSVSFFSPGSDYVSGDTNDVCDTFVRDRGEALGVGGLAANGKLTVAGSPGFRETGVISGAGAATVLDTVLAGQGAELFEARAVYRADTSDLFVRLDVTRMPTIGGSVLGPGLLYGLRLTANGVWYEVRAQRAPGLDFDAQGGASFGLFRQDDTTDEWRKVATLKGGYGTVGHAVVTAVPLDALGLASGGQLSDVTAFTAVGSYLSGSTKVLDSLRLSR